MKTIILDPSIVQRAAVPAKLAPLVREWVTYCHDRALRSSALIVDYESLIDVSRWSCKPRRRPFVVRRADTLGIVAGSKTLDGALRLARKLGRAAA